MFQSTYYSGEPFAKPAHNTGTYEYLVDYARRLLADDTGMVEVRDAYGTLKYQAYTDNGEIAEWTSEAQESPSRQGTSWRLGAIQEKTIGGS